MVIGTLVFVLILLVFASGDPECDCAGNHWCCPNGCDFPGSVNSGVDLLGGSYSCFCWINENRKSYGYTKFYKYKYLPSTTGTYGACGWCAATTGTKYDDIKTTYCHPIIGKCWNPKDGDYNRTVSKLSKQFVVRKNGTVKGGAVIVGNQPACVEACQEYQNENRLFIGEWVVNYWPSSVYSSAHCDCTGWIDPCKFP